MQTIRVISPSQSLSQKSQEKIDAAKSRLESLGFSVTFGEHAFELDELGSSPIKSRIVDLHAAFEDTSVDIILCAAGGFNAVQLLPYIDWEIIKNNPKRFCGFSDITVLNAAIYAKTGMITFNGPNFNNFARQDINGYRDHYFTKALLQSESYEINPATTYKDWNVLDADNNEFELNNSGWWVIQEGEAQGTVIGENLCSLNLLQGTEYMPPLSNTILCIEDDYESKEGNFIRDLQSLLLMPNASTIKGIVIGRFQIESKIGREKLTQIINQFDNLKKIPIIANVDFGHTSPRITIPVGGTITLNAYNTKSKITIHARQ